MEVKRVKSERYYEVRRAKASSAGQRQVPANTGMPGRLQRQALAETAAQFGRSVLADAVPAQMKHFEALGKRRLDQCQRSGIADAIVVEVEFAQAAQVRGVGEGLCAAVAQAGAAQVQDAQVRQKGGLGQQADAVIAHGVAGKVEQAHVLEARQR